MRIVLTAAVLVILIAGRPLADSDEQAWQPGISDLSAYANLTAATEYIDRLETEESAVQRRVLVRAAIDSLTALYQLHGCEWALQLLGNLHARPEAVGLWTGYSTDGRILASVERLELINPAYADYAVYLVTLESRTALNLQSAEQHQLRFALADDSEVVADLLDQSHPLWGKLGNMSGTFAPVSSLPPASGWSFKQLVSTVDHDPDKFRVVLLDWGGYELQLSKYANEVSEDGGHP